MVHNMIPNLLIFKIHHNKLLDLLHQFYAK